MATTLRFGRFFKPLRQYLVARSYSAHPFPSARVIEGLGSGDDFLGPLSRLVGNREKPWVGHWSALSPQRLRIVNPSRNRADGIYPDPAIWCWVPFEGAFANTLSPSERVR
jgi:hypothetical protein